MSTRDRAQAAFMICGWALLLASAISLGCPSAPKTTVDLTVKVTAECTETGQSGDFLELDCPRESTTTKGAEASASVRILFPRRNFLLMRAEDAGPGK